MTGQFDLYRRQHYASAARPTQLEERRWDVFNNPRQTHGGRNEDCYFRQMQSYCPQPQRPTDPGILRRTLQLSQLLHGEVADKVGATNMRDYTIPRPLLKIGKEITVDTYSPF